MKKSILAVMEAGSAIPSGYVRGQLYEKYFRKKDISIVYLNRLPASLVRLSETSFAFSRIFFFKAILKILIILLTYINEKVILRKVPNYEIIYLNKVVNFSFIKKLRNITKALMVLDVTDALWLAAFKKISFNNEILRTVDRVTTDNEYTAAYIRQFNKNCTVIPDCPQIEDFDAERQNIKKTSGDGKIILGWVGSPSTLYNLFLIWEPLEELFSKYQDKIHLRLVGTRHDLTRLPNFEKVIYSYTPAYDRKEMVKEVLSMDIGLYPLQNIEASLSRGVLKATVYMAGGAVAVCSPVGQCRELISDGVNGFLAADTKEWKEKIEFLINNPEKRKEMAQKGLETVRSQFTVEKSFEKLCGVLF